MQGSKYPDEERREAAILYGVRGTGAAVQRELSMPESTVSAAGGVHEVGEKD